MKIFGEMVLQNPIKIIPHLRFLNQRKIYLKAARSLTISRQLKKLCPYDRAGKDFTTIRKTYFMWAQQNNQLKEQVPFMNTLTSCVNKVVKDGFSDSFNITQRGLYSCSKNRYYNPGQVKVINFYRFEGQSDPADNAIMYVIETADGVKGTLIDAYGPYADAKVNIFMKEVEDMNKKVVKKDHRPEC